MAGIGHVWGTADELLHPRDRRGRFRKKWKMAEGVIRKILGFLDAFSPRMFANDAQAAQYLFNTPQVRFEGSDLTRLHMDYDEANEHLRSGDIDEPTKKFIDMMDRHKVPARDDIIISRTVGPEAFGLTPQQMGAEDGGIEDFTGRLIADRGYTAAHIGGILGGQAPGNGKITMRIAVPKGTSIIAPARNRDDRGLFLDRDQELRITKVQPDGAGGYYMLAVATPRTKGETPNPVNPSPRGVGLTPDQREARIKERATTYAHPPSELRDVEAANKRIATAEAARQAKSTKTGAPEPDLRLRQTEETVRPQTPEELPGGVEPRNNEPVLPQPGAPAQTPAAPEQPEAPVATPINFRQVVRDARLESPSAGPRRAQWNNAYLGVAGGRSDPGDKLRELETDIRQNKGLLEHLRETGHADDDPHLPSDIKAQEDLADLIAQHYGLERQTPVATPLKAAKKAAPAKAAKKAAPVKAAKKAAPTTPKAPVTPEVSAEKATETGGKPSWGTIKAVGLKDGDIVMWHGSDRKKPDAEGRRVRIVSRGLSGYSFVDPETGKAVQSNGVAHRAWLSQPLSGEATVKAVKRAAPAKAAPAKAAPAKAIPEQALVEESAKTPLNAAEEKSITEFFDGKKPTVLNLRVFARENDIDAGKIRTRAALVRHILSTIKDRRNRQGAYEPRRLGQTDKENALIAERKRVEPIAAGAVQINELLQNQASDKALRHVIESYAKKAKLSDETRDRLLSHISNRDDMQTAIDDLVREAGLTPVGRSGEVTLFDPEQHDAIGRPIDKGTPVYIHQQGYQWRHQGRDRLLTRARVQEATPEEARSVRRVPEGSVAGPKAQVPITSPSRGSDFDTAWNSADIKIPQGAAGRSMTEIRKDVSSGRITPEEGIRRMETEIAETQNEVNDIDSVLRGDMPAADRRRLIAQVDGLETAIGEQKKAATFMRQHFGQEAPTTQKQILELPLPKDVADAVRNADPEILKDEVVRQGLERPKGTTADEVIQDIARQMAKRELERRAAKKAVPAPKKVTPATMPKERDKIQVRLLAEGLGIDEWDQALAPGQTRYLDDVQNALDGKRVADLPPNSTPAAIGRWLESRAKMIKASAAIQFGGVREGDARDPEAERQVQELYRRADSLLKLAERLKKTRRQPVVKKAFRGSPEARAALARADGAENRLMDAALEGLRDAKTEDQVRDAVKSLTMPELRNLARQQGVTGRSKESLIKGLSDRHLGSVLGVDDLLKKLGDFDNPPSREAAHELIKGLSKGELLDMATQLSIPNAKRMSAADLRRSIVEATPGRRLDSIATRGFRGVRPDAPDTPLNPASPVTIVETSPGRGLPSTFFEPKPATSASKKPTGPPVRRIFNFDMGPDVAAKYGRTDGDEPLYLPNKGADQGLVHLDSQLGGLWQDLVTDNREPNSFVNAVARIGENVGTGTISLDQAASRLRALSASATDQAIVQRIEATIRGITEPTPPPSIDVPNGVPPSVRLWLEDLAQIPTMRKTDLPGNRRKQSVLDEALDLVRRISAGERVRNADLELIGITRNIHESVDGTYQARRLTERTFAGPTIVTGYRTGANGRTEEVTKPNPDWPEIRDWLRGRQATPSPTTPISSARSFGERAPAGPAREGGGDVRQLREAFVRRAERQLVAAKTRAEGELAISGLLKEELRAIARRMGLPVDGLRSKNDLIRAIVARGIEE